MLKGLAQTSEEELDSGRWTKWVQVSGKRRKCAFSIPNLLDPPDRAEWIRRGKMPDRRGHEIHFRHVQEFIDSVGGGMDIDELNEAINARFTGRSLDDYELPRNTPAERAEALYQDALGCFGRRRVLLAREALAEDPSHVEASILVAESTRAVDHRMELFQNAKQAAATALGNDMEDLAGEFWGFHETRPYMRACHGLAVAFADAGQISEAIEQYREMLRLNPNDNQGVRYEIVPLLLEQNRDAEAMEVLDQYPEESALWMYMKALVEFRRGGRSAKAKKAIRTAFKGNDHVLKLLRPTSRRSCRNPTPSAAPRRRRSVFRNCRRCGRKPRGSWSGCFRSTSCGSETGPNDSGTRNARIRRKPSVNGGDKRPAAASVRALFTSLSTAKAFQAARSGVLAEVMRLTAEADCGTCADLSSRRDLLSR